MTQDHQPLPSEFADLKAEWELRLQEARQLTASPKTRAAYDRIIERMRAKGLPPEKMAERSRRSWQLYRAALVHWCLTRLVTLHGIACTGDLSVRKERRA
jgi:hypothetical protein